MVQAHRHCMLFKAVLFLFSPGSLLLLFWRLPVLPELFCSTNKKLVTPYIAPHDSHLHTPHSWGSAQRGQEGDKALKRKIQTEGNKKNICTFMKLSFSNP